MINKTLDPLNPANWMPYYDDASDRRAVPAVFLLNEPDVQGYLYSVASADAGDDPWRVLTGTDRMTEAGCVWPIVLEYGRTAEKRVDPDCLLTFIRERDFIAHKPAVIASLKTAFDGLWAIHQAGNLSRADFDHRVEELRVVRGHYEGKMTL